MAFTLILLVCSLFVGSSYGNRSNSATGFRATIFHSNSRISHFYNQNVTKYDWAKVALEQSKEHIGYHAGKRLGKGFFIPTGASGLVYLMNITIGYPEENFSLIADTGSSLTWIQCVAREGKSYDPRRSSSYRSFPCSSECLATDMFECEDGGNCEFEVRYGLGGTQIYGEVGREMFTFRSDLESDDHNSVQLIFGCGTSGLGQTRKIDGIVGLNRNKMSLISQLSVKKFSYCFSHDLTPTKVKYMRFGSYARIMGRTTPMLHVPGSYHFHLYLEGISVGSSMLHLRRGVFNISKAGKGGFIIDSGTALTMLEPDAFWELKYALELKSGLPMIEDHESGFDVCFSGTLIDAEAMPYITFHFSSLNFTIPAHGAFQRVDEWTFCLMFEEISYGKVNILGNMAQVDHNIGYDLDKGVVLNLLV